jgi:Domain of unknown function (DUF4157)
MPAVPAMSLASGPSGLLQRKGGQAAAPSQFSTEAPPIVHDVLRSPGQPLDSGTRAFMEPRFGYDFSRVRVHADSRAAKSAEAVNAQAYTVGSNIVFGPNQGGAGNVAHQRLLAHELAHVVQQGGRPAGGSLQVAPANDNAEGAADRAADAVLSGGRTQANDLAGAEPRLARKVQGESCDSSNDEGKPLIWFDRAAPTHSWRPATGYAQKKLNQQIAIIKAAQANPAQWNALPQANRDFIVAELPKLTYPLAVDCKFGEQTERATKIVQAFYFKDKKEWDGKIGPLTWHVIDTPRAAPPKAKKPPSTIPIPNVPVPPSAKPMDI